MNGFDLVWTLTGFLLTLLVFSYIFGDNFLFRLAMYIFVGVTAGYLAVIVIYQLLWPRLLQPILVSVTDFPKLIILLIPALLSVLLLFKISPSLSRLGNIPVGFLVGTGAAVTIGGAVIGTLFGQISGTLKMFDFQPGAGRLGQLLIGLIILFGTVTTLIYFHFSAGKKGEDSPKRPAWIELLAGIGQVFIAITLGALFAGVYIAAMTALVDRVNFIQEILSKLLTL
jgi:hypothetical protein